MVIKLVQKLNRVAYQMCLQVVSISESLHTGGIYVCKLKYTSASWSIRLQAEVYVCKLKYTSAGWSWS